MWEFPSIQAFINSNGFQIVWTLGVSFFSLIAWFSVVYNAKESSKELLKNVLIGSATLLIVIFSSCGVVVKYKEAAKCRNLELDKVKGFRVMKLRDEENVAGPTLFFEDEKAAREGLATLRNAYDRGRKKDRFTKGYRLQVILEGNGDEEFYIYYFSETEKNQKTDIVIAHCDTEPNGFNFDGIGIYSSTTFGDWIRENIEPKFNE
jgi:hypothetical protein